MDIQAFQRLLIQRNALTTQQKVLQRQVLQRQQGVMLSPNPYPFSPPTPLLRASLATDQMEMAARFAALSLQSLLQNL